MSFGFGVGLSGFSPSGFGSHGLGALDLNNIIAQGFKFGETFLNAKYSKDAAKFGAGSYVSQLPTRTDSTTLTAEQLAAIAAAQRGGGGVGVGIDKDGVRLSDGTHIGWTTIALAGFAIYLIQSPGFSRRR